MPGLDGPQRTGRDTIPASHAHVVKNGRGIEDAVDLFEDFMGARRHSRADPVLGVADRRGAAVVIHYRK
jgi:hypothetical protein